MQRVELDKSKTEFLNSRNINSIISELHNYYFKETLSFSEINHLGKNIYLAVVMAGRAPIFKAGFKSKNKDQVRSSIGYLYAEIFLPIIFKFIYMALNDNQRPKNHAILIGNSTLDSNRMTESLLELLSKASQDDDNDNFEDNSNEDDENSRFLADISENNFEEDRKFNTDDPITDQIDLSIS